jgi:hypothetical protein
MLFDGLLESDIVEVVLFTFQQHQLSASPHLFALATVQLLYGDTIRLVELHPPQMSGLVLREP